MNEAELNHIARVAMELDALVPRIAEAMHVMKQPDDYRRLALLLKPAEKFLLDAGPIVARARPEPGPLRDTCERFMRELPRRLRMLRDARAISPPAAPEPRVPSFRTPAFSLARAG